MFYLFVKFEDLNEAVHKCMGRIDNLLRRAGVEVSFMYI